MNNVQNTLSIEPFLPATSYLRATTASPRVSIGDVMTNAEQITALYHQAVIAQASLVVFPELSLTGYTLGDLVQSLELLDRAKAHLLQLAAATHEQPTAMVIGLPLRLGNSLYNCAAFLADGVIKGIVPKQNLPTYKEFYEKRWYQSWGDKDNQIVVIGDQEITFGTRQLFAVDDALIGIEICEDLWVADAPHIRLARSGATIIVNPSASPELASKAAYRRQLVATTAATLGCAYIYAGADTSESTMDIVMSGHSLINENGHQLAERVPFSPSHNLLVADIDMQHLHFERLQNTNYPNDHDMTIQRTMLRPQQTDLRRSINSMPFIPRGDAATVTERLDEILTIQAVALSERLMRLPTQKVHLGLSGGLDSTLALLVAVRAATRCGVAAGDIIDTYTMPSTASSKRTQSNAQRLAASMHIPNRVIPIAQLTAAQLAALDHDGSEDTTYENTQARIRTALLFNAANKHGGMVLGTGDLSEIALGWCTFNGDHMSHYNVNASIPKTLVRHLVKHASHNVSASARAILLDILNTPVSPELTGNGTLSQATESIIGPYELHDFFLYHFIRFQDSAAKISYLAQQAFEDIYTAQEIAHYLTLFMTRFYANQWKRSVMPDGPKVGTVSLSPRGDWRMPSDAPRAVNVQFNDTATTWQKTARASKIIV